MPLVDKPFFSAESDFFKLCTPSTLLLVSVTPYFHMYFSGAGETAMHFASFEGHEKVINLLVEADASLSVKNMVNYARLPTRFLFMYPWLLLNTWRGCEQYGKTALDIATGRERFGAVAALERAIKRRKAEAEAARLKAKKAAARAHT